MFRVKFPALPYPRSVGTKDHAFDYMAAKLNVTPKELRQAARDGTLEPIVA